MINFETFRAAGQRLQKGQERVVSSKANLNVRFLSTSEAQNLVNTQEAIRSQIAQLTAGAAETDLVMGEVDGQVFVMTAEQAEQLISSAVDQANLVEQLKP